MYARFKRNSWSAEFGLCTRSRTLWLSAARFRGVSRLLAQTPALVLDVLLRAHCGPTRRELAGNSIAQRHRSEARTTHQAKLVQFLIKRHAANAEIGGGSKAVVAVTLQRRGDLLALDRLL